MGVIALGQRLQEFFRQIEADAVTAINHRHLGGADFAKQGGDVSLPGLRRDPGSIKAATIEAVAGHGHEDGFDRHDMQTPLRLNRCVKAVSVGISQMILISWENNG